MSEYKKLHARARQIHKTAMMKILKDRKIRLDELYAMPLCGDEHLIDRACNTCIICFKQFDPKNNFLGEDKNEKGTKL